METIPTEIPAVIRVIPTRHDDHRGFFSEVFRSEWFDGLEFIQDNHSRTSLPGTLRGLHFQVPPHAQDKLVRVTRGSIIDVAVDIRTGSPSFGKHVKVELSATNWEQLLVPRGFAHGFITLEPDTEVMYKVTDYYAPDHDRGLRWNDPDLGIDWGTDNPVVSERDAAHPTLAELQEGLVL